MKIKGLLIAMIFCLILVPLKAGAQTALLALGVADIGTLDPHFANKIGEVPIIRMVYQSLLRHPPGEIDVAKLQPSLATQWEVGDDKLTWTFHLRKGVKWHEGYGELTAEDVKFSIDRIINPDVGSPARKALAAVDSISVVDPYTVQIKTKQPYPVLPAMMVEERFGYIISKKAAEKLDKDIKYHPVGTGPFMFEAYKPRESFTLKANPDYWGDKPKLEKVEVSFMPDNSTRELALRNGEVHAINIPAKQEWIDRLKKAGFTVNLTSPANMFVLHFNLTKKPMDNKKVRMALCHAISRDILVQFLGKDVAKSEVSPLPSGYVGYTDNVVRYPYDVAKAKKFLVDAGHKDGFKLSMNISNSNIYLPPMQVIQEMWKKIGVDLELKVVDHPTYHKLIRKDVNPVVIYGAYRYPLTGTRYFTQFYHSDSIVGKETAIINFSHYGEALPGVDKYIDDARFELDVTKQIRLWEAAQKQIVEDCVAFPLFTRKYAMAKSKNFDQGFEQKSYSFYQVTEKSRIK
ncbi:MAG: polyamine ABC transporter substrate-binding protein [Desulfosarcina sp.]|nr:polyamine ABC transporter substrate-binding protein [Desulfosarcina sp.]MBC2742201.1 polyamine ABC transporter substrate-binding protein [Desulfosarcina sp.]MBC2765113.1 polyamine ABC transporter substrate-binding protein [Desulfosarcina sp.]